MAGKGKFTHASIKLYLCLLSEGLIRGRNLWLLDYLLVETVPLHGCHVVLHLHLLSLSRGVLLSDKEETDSFFGIFGHIAAASEGTHAKLTQDVTRRCNESI